jgi:hypothetical protein
VRWERGAASASRCRDNLQHAHPEAQLVRLAARADGRDPRDRRPKAWVRGSIDGRLLRCPDREVRPRWGTFGAHNLVIGLVRH